MFLINRQIFGHYYVGAGRIPPSEPDFVRPSGDGHGGDDGRGGGGHGAAAATTTTTTTAAAYGGGANTAGVGGGPRRDSQAVPGELFFKKRSLAIPTQVVR